MSATEADDPNVVDAELVQETPAPAALPATTPAPVVPEPDYTDKGVPSFDYVRDRVENRFTTSTGETELAGLGTDQTVESLDKKLADRDQAGRDKLAEIRRAMRGE